MSNAVATVAFLRGQAWAKSPDGSLRELTLGSVLNEGEILVTAKGARVELDTGNGEPLAIQGGQEVAMSRDFSVDTATSTDEALLTDASVQEALTILEQGGDLTETMEATAAGINGGEGGGHSFVQLTRIVEETDPLAFHYGRMSVDPNSQDVNDDNIINHAPLVKDQTLTGDEDTAITGQVIASDVEGDELSFALTNPPANGTLVLDPVTGNFVYTPTANYNGSDSFVVTVTDSHGNSRTTTISLNIAPVNDAPVSSDQSLTTNEDTPVSGQVVASDIEGDSLTYTATTQPLNGVLTINEATGEFVYTPNANYNGNDSFVITISDGHGGVTTSTISVGITPINDAPVSQDQTLSTVEDMPLSGQIMASDVDGDALTYIPSIEPANGTLVLDSATGAFTYTPNPNYYGNDSFVVAISDGYGGTTTSTITIGVTPVNDAPVTNNQSLTTQEDVALNGKIVASDIDGDELNYTATTLPLHGSLMVDAVTGNFVYTPNTNYNGSDSFVVTVSDGQGGVAFSTINIGITPTSPVLDAVNDLVTLNEDGMISGSVATNDQLGETPSNFALVSNVTNGVLVFNANGTYTYTPQANYYGSDSFTYSITDADGNTDTATVSITVNSVDDLPVIAAGSGSVVEDTQPSTGGTLTATDVDNPSLAFVASTQAGNYGSVVLGADGVWTYTLDARANALAAGEAQTESFTVNLTDGSTTTITINITGTDDAPVIAAGAGSVVEDTQPSTGGTLTATDVDNPSLAFVASTQSGNYGSVMLGADGVWTYTLDARANALAAGEAQTENFTVSLTDGSTTTITVNITGTDDLPVIAAGSGSVVEESQPSTGGTLTATDLDNPSLAFVASTQSGNYGSVVLGADGVWTYTLDARANALAAGEAQTESFTVNLTDGSTTTITVTITGTDDLPVIAAGSGSVVEDTQPSTGGTLTATDLDNPSLAFVASTQSGNYGSVMLGTDGVWTYTLDARANALAAGEAQTESFTVNLTDGSTTTITVNITGTDDAPVIAAGSGSVVEDTQPSTGGTLTATDVDNPSLAFVASMQSGNYGSVILGADGVWTYTLDARANALAAGEAQTENFTVNLTDGSTTTITVNITGTDDAPVIAAGSGSVVEESQPSTGGTLTATDVDNPSLAFVASTQSGNYGSVMLGTDGVWTYTLDARANALAAGEAQTESFTVNLTDGSTTTITVNITGTDDAPVIAAGSGSVVEESQPSTGGTLTATDLDNPSLAFVASTQSGNYRSVMLGANGVWTYTLDARANALAAGEAQTESFIVNLTDGSTTTITVNVVGTNDLPIANTDVAATDYVTSVTFSVLDNDSDVDGDTLSVTNASVDPALGTVVVNANNTLTFTPLAGVSGSVSISYSISDGNGGTASSSVTVTVAPPSNQAPVAVDDYFATPYSINIGNTSADLWGNLASKGVTLSFLKVDGTAGSMYERPDDHAIGVADEGRAGTPFVFEAPLQIEYNQATGTSEALVINFTQGNLNQATFSVSNLFPGENGGEVGAWEVYYQGSLVAADTFYLTDGSDKGSFTINTGSLVFDSVKFTALNTNNGLGDGGDYFITNFIGSGPANSNTAYTVAEGAALNVDSMSGLSLLDNDSDADGDSLQITHINGVAITDGEVVVLPSGAILTINTDGSFHYDTSTAFTYLNAGQVTTNSFTYTVSDGHGGSDIATATMTVIGTGSGFNTTGTSADNTIKGSSQADIIVGGAGDDNLMGALGADTFVWSLADKGSAGSSAVDKIFDFSKTQGDVLNVSDLLQGENSGNLTDYMHFTYDNASNTTTLHISSSGGYNSGYSDTATDQQIVLNGINLVNGATDADIINQLKTAGQLITD